jgi:hypothetical protein
MYQSENGNDLAKLGACEEALRITDLCIYWWGEMADVTTHLALLASK